MTSVSEHKEGGQTASAIETGGTGEGQGQGSAKYEELGGGGENATVAAQAEVNIAGMCGTHGQDLTGGSNAAAAVAAAAAAAASGGAFGASQARGLAAKKRGIRPPGHVRRGREGQTNWLLGYLFMGLDHSFYVMYAFAHELRWMYATGKYKARTEWITLEATRRAIRYS